MQGPSRNAVPYSGVVGEGISSAQTYGLIRIAEDLGLMGRLVVHQFPCSRFRLMKTSAPWAHLLGQARFDSLLI